MSNLKLLFIAFRMGSMLIDYAKAKNPNERRTIFDEMHYYEKIILKEENDRD